MVKVLGFSPPEGPGARGRCGPVGSGADPVREGVVLAPVAGPSAVLAGELRFMLSA